MRIAKLRRVAAVGLVAGLLATALPATLAHAAEEPVWDDTSSGPLYLLSNGDYNTPAAGTELTWDSGIGVVGSPVFVDGEEDWGTDFANLYFPHSDGEYAYTPFISLPGQERTVSAWQAYADTVIISAPGILAPNLTPIQFPYGTPGQAGLRSAGGTYSIGIAVRDRLGSVPGNTVLAAYYTTISVDAGTGNYKFATPTVPVPQAPVVTQQPANVSVDLGATATFTAAATDATEVKWQSSSDGTTWADVNGATSATLTVANVTAAQNGTQYHAVFTNASGSVTTDAATLTVTGPVEPQAGDPNEVTIPAPAEGATSITVPAGAANANKTFTVWAWSDRTNLGQVTTDADGNATVDVSSLGVGEHTIALAESDFSIKAWGAVTLASLTTTKTDLAVDVTTSNKFELQGVASSADLGQVQRGQTSAPVALGAFTVVDDRALLPGWTLTTAVDDFTNASADNDVVSKSALGLAPAAVSDLPVGVSLGTAQTAGSGEYPALFAQGAEDSSTLEAGTQLNADLSFAAPASAKAGTYSSTLTLSLVSK
ncbi:hypothetical protein GCM10009785_33110 [Brooklawnia cerclae]|uniref:Immunoglobulin domain-containing protein n=1 Tax=Brooklawnia cerclae TaxID=349934 RepID=A0ABX0SBL4_9ACTN|nr:hypothetical protein [Brooklawnia cerclae]NIH55773.1 hypothetical protein [Brooklawnia cerclae]